VSGGEKRHRKRKRKREREVNDRDVLGLSKDPRYILATSTSPHLNSETIKSEQEKTDGQRNSASAAEAEFLVAITNRPHSRMIDAVHQETVG
jgi:hypothetical protein